MRTSTPTNNYNSPSFGINKAKNWKSKQVLDELHRINPEAKNELDLALNKFCNFTQGIGIKGTFTPTKVNCNNGLTTLEYRIDGLHANGNIKPHKMPKFKRGEIYVNNYPNQKPNSNQKAPRNSKIKDTITLTHEYERNGNSDNIFFSLLSSVMRKFDISISHIVSGYQKAGGTHQKSRYLNHQNTYRRK